MSEEFKKAYSELELVDKRNELNNEMKMTLEMLSTIKQVLGVVNISDDVIEDYDMLNHNNISESEMLDILYCNFHIIEKKIIDIGKSITS